MIHAPPPPKTTIQAEPELGGRAAFAWQFGAVEHYAAWTVQWGEPIRVDPSTTTSESSLLRSLTLNLRSQLSNT